MQSYTREARPPGALQRTLQDAVAMLVQDSAEYGFVGFTGASVAAFAVVVLRLMHNAVSDALVAPLVLAAGALTLSTATMAFCRATENLQPDATEALGRLAARPMAFARAWLPMAGALFVAGLALGLGGQWLGSWRFPLVMAVVALSALYVFSHSFYAVSVVTQRATVREAELVATVLLGRTATLAALAWLPVLAPTLVAALIAQITGFGVVSTAVVAFVGVMSMPAAAAVMSLLFFDAVKGALRAEART
ncbi:MAG TPA: hypothetical protein VEZ14_09195 [Dehalococcoidia bacterium]|nr:hypothetical protein [Dehalococcoidia bacterium]